jgi:CDP-4-dehydro-6-deoxyglucose reductase
MSFCITIEPSGHRFDADTDRSILEAALDHGFMLPYGCRNGACGSCKGRVLAGEVDHGKAQEGALTLQDRAQGLTLFCCARPLSDLSIECREIGAAKDIPIRTLPCRVKTLERVAPDVTVMRLQLPANERLQFLAGQYIDFLLKDGRRRSFSLANAPHADGYLELHLRLAPGGQFTEHVFNTMKERDILRFEGPLGSFFLREHAEDGGDKPVLMVAGGTGFAPMKAIMEHALHTGITRPMVLYWGARNRAGLYLDELPRQWAAQMPNFTYVPVLSEPGPEDEWTGRTGLVHTAAMQDIMDLSGWQAYVCGAPAMVDAAKKDFTQRRNLPIDEFYADSFSFAAS